MGRYDSTRPDSAPSDSAADEYPTGNVEAAKKILSGSDRREAPLTRLIRSP